MYNADQRYEAHKLYLEELCAQQARHRMLAGIPRRPTIAQRVAMNLSVVLMALGAWLERSARRDEQVAWDG